ncbi:MAG: class I SAM-dependent methyltransferase [Thermodesulfobacteriota bacterium]
MNIRTLHAIANGLRKIGLLQAVDWLLYLKELININVIKANREFLSNHIDFPVPPKHLAFDAYGGFRWEAYFNSGVMHAKVIGDILNKELTADNVRIFEWGCGPGRIVRHLRGALTHRNVELCGSDYNAESIEWCRENIKGVEFFTNQARPPFPFESNFLDCVCAVSVFTHLSEKMHFEWMKELRRVLKPNGLLIITTHSDSASDRLLSHEKQLYDSGKLVVRGNIKGGKKWCLAYHPSEFVRNELLETFTVVSQNYFLPTQDIWVAKKSGIMV